MDISFVETLAKMCKNETTRDNKKYALIVAYADAERSHEVARFGSFSGARDFVKVKSLAKILENRSFTGEPYGGKTGKDYWWRVILATDEQNNEINNLIDRGQV